MLFPSLSKATPYIRGSIHEALIYKAANNRVLGIQCSNFKYTTSTKIPVLKVPILSPTFSLSKLIFNFKITLLLCQ